MIDEAITELAPVVGVRAACAALGRAQATHYRRHSQSPPPARPARSRSPQPRALSTAERARIREVLNSPEHADQAPAAVYHHLLDSGVYLASVSTMYRVLREHGEVRERRRHAVHPARVKPELVADAPNVCWSWDITKLAGPAKWTYYYLYVILDIYSRYVVGWLIAEAESAVLAEKLLADSIAKQQVDRGRLTIHADNGSLMACQTGGVPAGRPGGHQDPLPAAYQQRQPLLRSPVQDPQIPARLPRPIRRFDRRTRVLPGVFHLVQHRALPLGHRLPPPGGCPLRTGPGPARGPCRGPGHRLHPQPATVRA